MRAIIPVTVGALTYTSLQAAWTYSHPHAVGDEARVFSGVFGLTICSAIFAVATAITVAYRHEATDLIRRTRLLWFGVLATMVAADLIIGPGKLWVFRIATVSALVGGVMIVGAVVGQAIASRKIGAKRDAA